MFCTFDIVWNLLLGPPSPSLNASSGCLQIIILMQNYPIWQLWSYIQQNVFKLALTRNVVIEYEWFMGRIISRRILNSMTGTLCPLQQRNRYTHVERCFYTIEAAATAASTFQRDWNQSSDLYCLHCFQIFISNATWHGKMFVFREVSHMSLVYTSPSLFGALFYNPFLISNLGSTHVCL